MQGHCLVLGGRELMDQLKRPVGLGLQGSLLFILTGILESQIILGEKMSSISSRVNGTIHQDLMQAVT